MSPSLKSININSKNFTYVGVDVAKDKLDIFIPTTKQFFTISNTKAGITKFIKTQLSKVENPLVICESTGGWERIMVLHLTKHNVPSHIAHASKIYHYAKSKGITAKTDKLDAKIIAAFAISESIKPSEITSDTHMELKGLSRINFTNLFPIKTCII